MSYGPKLTAKQFKALQAEIAAFDEKATLAEIERMATGGKDIDAYQKWMNENAGREPIEANPDNLTDESSTPWGRTQERNTVGLSEREKNVWAMCNESGRSQADVAEQLGITRKSVEMALRRATKKLKGQL